MEVGRSSTVLLLLLALMLTASSTTAAAAVHHGRPPTASYQLIAVETSHGDKTKLAMRAGDSPIAGFANGKDVWFAIQGSEELMEPLRNRYGGGGGGGSIPGHGLVNLLGAMLKKNATK